MIDHLPDLRTANVSGKTVFLRADLDVPLSQQSTIVDDLRLNAWFPTLKYLLNKHAKVIIAGHLGRPKGEIKKEFSLGPVAKWIEKETKLRARPENIESFSGWRFADNLFLLENLRFFKEEEENDLEFAKKLAALADIYVNDAFAVSHRNNASVAGVPKFLLHFAGFRLEEEVKVLSSLMENPKRPLIVIVAGAKIETKLPLISKMHDFADYVLIGGKLAAESKVLFKLQHEKRDKVRSALLISEPVEAGDDITKESLENFLQIIKLAKTVVWNGPLGKVEEVGKRENTRKLAKGIIESGAYSVVGGGDTIAFLDKEKLLSKFSFYSIGGGAMLAFLSGENLPGLEALKY